jgi:hypothetical protein
VHQDFTIKATWVKDAVLSSMKLSYGSLKFLVDILSAANESHRGQSETMSVKCMLSSLNNSWMAGQTKVVIGAEVHHFRIRALHLDLTSLWSGDNTLMLEGSSGFNLVECVGESIGANEKME